MEVLPNAPDNPAAAEQILDKYLQAIGGAQQLSKISSFVAKGTYAGFDTDFQKVPTEISAKAPNQRTMTNHLPGGDNTTTYDGREGWIAAADPQVPMILLTGGDLDGAKLDAELAFPPLRSSRTSASGTPDYRPSRSTIVSLKSWREQQPTERA